MIQQKFSFKQRLRSFTYALNGLKVVIREEHNARIHLVAAAIVICLGFFFGISRFEWIAVALCIGAVLAAEIFNTAIEDIADFISPGKHEKIKRIKDLAAAAVLVCAAASVTVGLIIFLPRLMNW